MRNELKSPAPIQSRLEHLRAKGYIEWAEGKARTIRIVQSVRGGVPVLRSLLVVYSNPFTDTTTGFLAGSYHPKLCPAGDVGDSMIEDLITEGCSDYATSTRTDQLKMAPSLRQE